MDIKSCGIKQQDGDLEVVPLAPAAIKSETTIAELATFNLHDILQKVHEIKKVAPRSPQITNEMVMGNIYIRPMTFHEVGSIVSGHAHNFDHMTLILSGAVNLRIWEIDPATGRRAGSVLDSEGIEIRVGEPIREKQYAAPAAVLIKSNLAHEFTALEPNTSALCIFAHRDYEGNVVQDWNGNNFANQ